MKLFTRYNRINLSGMTIVFLLFGAVYYLLISKVLVHEVDEALGKYEKQVDKYVSKNDSLPVFKNFEEVQVSYVRSNKKQKSQYNTVKLFNVDDNKMDTFRQLVFSQRVKGQRYLITVNKPLEGTKLLTRTVAVSTIGMLLFIILISSLLNHLVLRKLWRPFYIAMDEMKGFKLGSKTTPALPESDIDEFSLMNQSLAAAITSAKDDYRILKEFTENASHETQTPLAIIRSKLDLVIQEEGLSLSQSEALKSAYDAVRRLSKLNQSLLLLAKIENQQYSTVAEIDMGMVVDEKIQQFHEFWEGNDISLRTTLQPALIRANPELIDVLLNNLLSNAGRHNVNGGTIRILLAPGRLAISNTAATAMLDEKKLFTRFYKQSQHSKHNGLGLSIIKQICEASNIQVFYAFTDAQHHFSLTW